MMIVTHVITRLIVGGAQENTIASVLGLRQKPGIDVDLISGPSPGREGSLEAAFAPHPGVLTILPQLVRPIHPWQDFRAWLRLTKIFRQRRPDIVHTHSGKAGILGRLAASRAKVPVIVHTIHGPSFGNFQSPRANLPLLAAERLAGRHTTHFVTVAEAMKTQYLAAGIGTPSQYTTILSGFDQGPFLNARNDPALRAKFGIEPNDIVIGKIARLFKLKGHDDLLAIALSVASVPSRPGESAIKFLFVGDGPWRQRFEQKARGLGLEKRFIFTGPVQPHEVAPLVGIMDILVHLSSREGLARALPQALAAAKPVVAYDCDGAREVCLDNETGFLVHPGDLSTLADRLLKLANDPTLRHRLGASGRTLIGDRFTVSRMVDNLYNLYLTLLNTHSTSLLPSMAKGTA